MVSSSAAIFGELIVLPIREDHPIAPDTPYGASKLCAEKQALAYARLYGLEVVCLRYFNVYGPLQRFDAYGNVIPIFVFKSLKGERVTIFGDGEQTRDFVNVADVVQANMRAAFSRGTTGVFNIGSGRPTTVNELVRLLEEMGLPIAAAHGPARQGDVRHSVADISAANRAIGYAPSASMDQALAEYVTWARTSLGS